MEENDIFDSVVNNRDKTPPNGQVLLPNGRFGFAPGNTVNQGNNRSKPRTNLNQIIRNDTDYPKFAEYLRTKGLAYVIQDIEELAPLDRLKCIIALLPYVLPKIANVEVKDDAKVHNLGKQKHTVVIRDMIQGTTQEVELI